MGGNPWYKPSNRCDYYFFEQHEFEQGSTYTWIFSNKYYSGTQSSGGWTQGYKTTNAEIADHGLERPWILVSEGQSWNRVLRNFLFCLPSSVSLSIHSPSSCRPSIPPFLLSFLLPFPSKDLSRGGICLRSSRETPHSGLPLQPPWADQLLITQRVVR